MTVTDTPTASESPAGRFPFPFPADEYRYSTNVEPADRTVDTAAGSWGAALVDVDRHYAAELAERADILADDPSRLAVLPHMAPAAWDAMLTLMRELAEVRPDVMTLARLDGDRWRWTNRLLGIDVEFDYGDPSTLPAEPLAFIGAQVQEDIALLDQRDDQLYVDAGLVTFGADWSFGFDVGMSFLEIHGPVPRVRREGVITRAHEFIKSLQPHRPYRRTNWSLTIGRRLDVSTERYPHWGPDRELVQTVDDETFGRLVHLRVEVQHLVRLPDSGAVMFLIRTYLMPLEELAAVEPWRTRTAAVLAELPEDMAEYKGIDKYKDRAARWLERHPADRPPGLPDWPTRPAEPDTGAASFLLVAIGHDRLVSHTAQTWLNAARVIAPTRMLVLDSLSDADDRTRLIDELTRTRTGVRIHVTGGQYDVLTALALARESGALAEELACFVTGLDDLPMYCAQCRATHRVVGAPGETVTCPGCRRRVEIHPHHAAVHGSFLASGAGGPVSTEAAS
ncbi:MAG: DUF3445 domain-containing protein [Gordonia sp. (in: high G+C Gram-positive bacteria)]|uniref:heme-dependent oxidative N-demethylase subunit alpha family protein n=1 Tax=Gordonia sp. (in: high G+C Gram-positive bacteria) TaxID=84139 RepID=UPI0039E5BAE3